MPLTTRPVHKEQRGETRDSSVSSVSRPPRVAFVEDAPDSSVSSVSRPPPVAFVEDASEEETEWQDLKTAPYDPSYAPPESPQATVSKSTTHVASIPRRPQTRGVDESRYHWSGPTVGNNSYQRPPDISDSYDSYRSHLPPRRATTRPASAHNPVHNHQPASARNPVQPAVSYYNNHQPAHGPPGIYARHIPAEIISIDRDPEKLVPFADLWQTEAEGGELSTWLQPKSCLPDNTQCEILTIQTLENGLDEAGKAGTTLICNNGPPRSDIRSEPQVYWL